MEQVTMPKLGLTMTEGTVSQWKASPGDRVKKDEVLLVVATDKLTYEVVSPIDGAVLEILVNEGETVPVGTVLAVLGAEGEKAPAAPRQVEKRGPEPVSKEPEERSMRIFAKSTSVVPLIAGTLGLVPSTPFITVMSIVRTVSSTRTTMRS
ncbi:MAG: Dihydrolipoyllysine-residue acetyltransferase component of pyruvate dehydrogenase complex [Synergistetes bacterium ADurb.Bin155]|nr:MAG: Dihydrolipoyllysine-residue acetyltransferase component of pyruvate dehydrogenase complex [Synergistetes bacterium ADurb.Bin155]